MKHSVTIALALAALGTTSTAQNAGTPISVPGPPHRATIEMATGEITRGDGQKSCPMILRFENTDWSGDYMIPGSGVEVLDWGIMPGHPSITDWVSEYCTAYGTTVLDTMWGGSGVSMCNSFYDDVMGWCNESGMGLQPTALYCFSALPGSPDGVTPWAWTISVSLTGGYEFTQDEGPFGYSMSFFDSETGPLLCYAGDANYGYGMDSNGQEDAYDYYDPTVASGTCGTYWFGGYPMNVSSWWLEVSTYATPASCSWTDRNFKLLPRGPLVPLSFDLSRSLALLVLLILLSLPSSHRFSP